MIRLVSGTIESVEGDAVVITTGGIGYQVYVTTPDTFTTGDTITLHTYHAIRDTASDLYGFLNTTERMVFELLLKVPKIGPKSALTVLTQASSQLLIESIARNDAAYLQKLSSVGKKTCENIVNQLHGKLPPELEAAAAATPTDELSQIHADAIDALITLGYAPEAARAAVQSLPDQSESTTVNQLVTHALKEIK